MKELLVDLKGIEFEDGGEFVLEKDSEGYPTPDALAIVKMIPEIVELNQVIGTLGTQGEAGYHVLLQHGQVMEGVEFNPPKKKG